MRQGYVVFIGLIAATSGLAPVIPSSPWRFASRPLASRPLDEYHVQLEEAQPALVDVKRAIKTRQSKRRQLRSLLVQARDLPMTQLNRIRKELDAHACALEDLDDERRRLVRQAKAALWRQQRAAARSVREW